MALGPLEPLHLDRRHLFFTGKGGVGKTTLACAVALALADSGRRVLLVSTDPASNLDEMLGTKLGASPTEVAGVPRLFAMNIDPQTAAEGYRQRALAPFVGKSTEAEIARMREGLSGACTTEIAAFDAFAGLLAGDDAEAARFDHVVFDTAPTGHTLRLLELPRAWTDFFETNERGASCLGPHGALTTRRDRFASARRALEDPARTVVVLVARPDTPSLREADRTAAELLALGLANQVLVVNAVFHATREDDAVAVALEARGRAALEALPESLRRLPRAEIPLRAFNTVGLTALRAILAPPPPGESAVTTVEPLRERLAPLTELVDEIASGPPGLVLVMGKGGVGKTTIAAAIAVELAARGIDVHLSTTDPAAHVAATIDGAVPHLEVSRIDPAAETRGYVDRVLAIKGANLDEEGRALLLEDLKSPCTEEVAVFHAFSRTVARARGRFVVLDTAPTGHTLLLLDATGAYHRDFMRSVSPGTRVVTPLMRLQDPSYSKVLLVTLPETTPVSEAAQLQEELRRAQIEPFAWIVNGSVLAAGTRDPLLLRRAEAERAQIARVREGLARRMVVVPWAPYAPQGPAALRRLARGASAGTA